MCIRDMTSSAVFCFKQKTAYEISACLVGSAKNSEKRRARLQQIAGMDRAELDRIHAPIGLPIGSKTPAEIALSVMADIVRVKNRGLSAA